MTNVTGLDKHAAKMASLRNWDTNEVSTDFPFKPTDTSKLIENAPAAVDWLVYERIQMGRGIVTTGLGGTSKTRIGYHLGIAFSIKRLPWNWQVTRTGKSVLVLTEDTEGDVHRTLWSMANAMSLSENERKAVAENMVIYPLAGHDFKLLGVDPNSKALVQNGLLKQLEAQINTIGDVVFVFLDPALSLTPGDENDQGHQRALGKMADDMAVRTGAAVMLVAHAAKSIQGRDELDSHSARGGGAITDAVRGEFTMRSMTIKEAKAAGITDLEERRRHVQLTATKGNHLPPAAYVPVWLRRGEGGTLSEAQLPLNPDSVFSIKSADMAILNVLKDLCKTNVPALRDWRSACIKAMHIENGPANTQEQAMKRAISRLVTAGLVKQGSSRGIYLPVDDADE